MGRIRVMNPSPLEKYFFLINETERRRRGKN